MKSLNRFAAFQETRQRNREELIKRLLQDLRRDKVYFNFTTDLAGFVATHVSNAENQPCNRATLLRNNRYRSLLDEYPFTNFASKSSRISSKRTEVAKFSDDLVASNLRQKLARLETYCSTLEAKLATQTVESEVKAKLDTNCPSTEPMVRESLARTCQALLLILNYLPGQFTVDTTSGVLRDAIKRRGDDVVVGSLNFGPFIEWLQTQQKIR